MEGWMSKFVPTTHILFGEKFALTSNLLPSYNLPSTLSDRNNYPQNMAAIFYKNAILKLDIYETL